MLLSGAVMMKVGQLTGSCFLDFTFYFSYKWCIIFSTSFSPRANVFLPVQVLVVETHSNTSHVFACCKIKDRFYSDHLGSIPSLFYFILFFCIGKHSKLCALAHAAHQLCHWPLLSPGVNVLMNGLLGRASSFVSHLDRAAVSVNKPRVRDIRLVLEVNSHAATEYSMYWFVVRKVCLRLKTLTREQIYSTLFIKQS